MRHLKRVHGLSLSRLHEAYYGTDENEPIAELAYCPSASMRADGLTKSFLVPAEWKRVREMLCIRSAHFRALASNEAGNVKELLE